MTQKNDSLIGGEQVGGVVGLAILSQKIGALKNMTRTLLYLRHPCIPLCHRYIDIDRYTELGAHYNCLSAMTF